VRDPFFEREMVRSGVLLGELEAIPRIVVEVERGRPIDSECRAERLLRDRDIPGASADSGDER
jgi:hypothetical protein